MCAINCSGGCPECSPEDHVVLVCDSCGIHTFEIDMQWTGDLGYSGMRCGKGKGCDADNGVGEY